MCFVETDRESNNMDYYNIGFNVYIHPKVWIKSRRQLKNMLKKIQNFKCQIFILSKKLFVFINIQNFIFNSYKNFFKLISVNIFRY